MRNNEPHPVLVREPLQVSPCLGSGIRAIFKGFGGEPDFAMPIVAMVVCRVRENWYLEGRLVRRGKVTRELCGVTTSDETGFDICEDTSNFGGYLQPGEELQK